MKVNKTIRIDLHGLYVEDAIAMLKEKVEKCPRDVEKIVVVHGYNHGTALKDAVRRVRSPRIVEIAPSFVNEGETYIWLRS